MDFLTHTPVSPWPDRACLAGGHCSETGVEKPRSEGDTEEEMGSIVSWCLGGMVDQLTGSPVDSQDTPSNLVATDHKRSEQDLEAHEGDMGEEETGRTR
ncbi:hypothetical protein NDU88_011607 [Pleurodeles waltl]|uniref:Uncharacterized protein n=1 Tax=Pleurodeles waltl TaxID=8319 RepID=A0AAV7R3H6_PLEWA|nr:hypothetical protein NDU88_011607 [Pleurodeles waltl]